MKKNIFLIFFFPWITFSQVIEMEKKERDKMEFSGVYKSSLSLELGGKSGYSGISYDLFLSPKMRIGVGAGLPGVGTDFKYYPFGVGRDRVLLNVGVRANYLFPLTSTDYIFYSAPIGLSYFGANRLNFEFDIGPLLKQPINSSGIDHGFGKEVKYIWGSIKIGYRFSFYAMKRARRLNAN